jgi:hypothetical protein
LPRLRFGFMDYKGLKGVMCKTAFFIHGKGHRGNKGRRRVW